MDIRIKVAVCIIVGFMVFVIAFSCFHIGRQFGYSEGWNDAMKTITRAIRQINRDLDLTRYDIWI